MKKNVIALLLSVVLAVGNIGTVPVMAAETPAQDEISGETVETGDTALHSEEAEDAEADAEQQTEMDSETITETAEEEPEQEQEEHAGEGEEQQEDLASESEAQQEDTLEETKESAGETDTSAAIDNTEDGAMAEEEFSVEEGKEAKQAVDVVDSGICGNNATWTLTGTDDNLTLTISGNGDMSEFSESSIPWIAERDKIKAVVIKDGITSIGSYAFYSLNKVKSVTIPDGVTEIGNSAFSYCSSLRDIYYGGTKSEWDAIDGSGFYTYMDNLALHTSDGVYGLVSAEEITLNKTSATLVKGASLQLKATVTPAEITLNKTSATLVKGASLQLKATVTPADASDGMVTWKSSNTKVATVASTGRIKAVAVGTATITAYTGGETLKATCTIKVVNPYTIKFNKNATKATLSTASKKVNPGSAIGTLPTPKYSGYYFQGWYTAKTGGKKITTSTKPSKNMTLYAHWVVCKSIKKATVKVASCMYSAEACKPAVTVKLGTKTLKKGQDYSVAYSNNIAVGSKALVKITGKGQYKDSISKNFTINKCSMDKKYISAKLAQTTYNYSGKAKTPSITVYLNGKHKLKKETDYKVSYKNNIEPGKATVQITGRGNFVSKSRSFTFTINKINQPIKLSRTSLSLQYKDIGTTYDVTATGVKESAGLTVSSSNTSVAAVSGSNGKYKIKIKGVGKANIVFKTNKATKHYKVTTKTLSITVVDNRKTPTITLPQQTYDLHVGDAAFNLGASCDSDGTLTYTSSDTDILTVDQDGTVTIAGDQEGTVSITITSNATKNYIKGTAEVSITVSHTQGLTYVERIELDEYTLRLYEGQTVQITSTVIPENASNTTLLWSSFNEGVAEVDENGFVTALSEGETVITAEAQDGSGVTAECEVTVVRPDITVTRIELDHEELQLTAGEEATLVATVEPYDATEQGLTWKSSDEDVATVDEDGCVTAVAEGEARITVSATDGSGETAECIVRVSPYIIYVEGIELSNDTLRLCVDDTIRITATVTPEEASKPALLWSSSNENIAKVDENGFVTAISEGEAVITAEAQDGSGVKAKCEMTVLPADYTNPIEDFTFEVLNGTYCSVTGYTGADSVIIIPEKDADGHYVQSIGSSAFNGKTFISKVVVSKRVTSIEEYAFYGCTSLNAVYGGQSLEEICTGAFEGCSALTNVDLEEGLEIIQANAFAECTSLESIHLPDSITGMGQRVFDGCAKLSSVSPFTSCVNLKKMEVPEGIETIPASAFANMASLTEITLPSTLKHIEEAAFRNCSGLPEITLPASLLSIGNYAFRDCIGFTEIELPAKIENISESCFSGCTYLKNVNLPDGLKTIQANAFAECTSLQSIHLPDSITGMGCKVFDGCKKLSSVNYPMGWDSPFTSCVNLKKMEVPEGIETIPASAFANMASVTDFILPSTLKTIEEKSCANCKEFGWTYFPISINSIADNAFDDFGEDLTMESEYGAYVIDYAKSKGIPYYYLSLTSSNVPGGTLYQGYSFNMYGYVRSTVNITEITATINDASGASIRSCTVEPNVTDYNLAGGFAGTLSLSTLPLGEYTFTLSAATSETSETFVSRSFSVVEAPLMVNLSGYSLHSGVMGEGESKPVTGTLSTNYPITHAAVRVLPDGGSAEDIVAASPNVEGYELGSLGANLSTLAEGDYTVSIIVEGHGQTREVGIVDICVGNGGLPSGSSILDSEFAAFVSDESNKEYWMNQFPGIVSYEIALINAAGSDPWTGMSVYFENYSDYAKNFAEDLFTGKLDGFKSETFYVDMAKAEIKSLIEDLGTAGFAEYSYDKTMAEKVGSAFLKGNKLTSEMFKDSAYALQPYDERFIDDWNETAKGLGNAYKIISTCEEVSEILVNCTMDFSQGMAVLDGLKNSCPYTGEYNKYYQKAVEELRWEFSGYITNAISRVMNYAKEKMVDEGVDKLTEEMLGAYSKSYSLAKLFWKVVGYSGAYDSGKEYINYLMRMQSYINAEKNYEEAFQDVLDGDTSHAAKARLASRFELTRRCAVRALKYMQTMSGSYMDQMDMVGVAELEYKLEYNTKCPFLN